MKKIKFFYILIICIVVSGILSCTKDKIEPFVIDSTVKLDSLNANAGKDFEISSPRDFIFLDASGTIQANPSINDIQYKWRCLSYPQGTVPPVFISQNEKLTEVDGLQLGKYVFEMEVRFQHVKSFDFVDVTVNPDGLIGKTVLYESVSIVELNPVTNISELYLQIISGDLVGRDKNNMRIEFWNDHLSKWKPVSYFSLFSREGRIKFESPWWDYPEFYNPGTSTGKGLQVRINYN